MTEDLAILRRPQVEAITGRSYSSIRRDMEAGVFPRPVQIGPRAIGWRRADLNAWLEARQVADVPAVGGRRK